MLLTDRFKYYERTIESTQTGRSFEWPSTLARKTVHSEGYSHVGDIVMLVIIFVDVGAQR